MINTMQSLYQGIRTNSQRGSQPQPLHVTMAHRDSSHGAQRPTQGLQKAYSRYMGAENYHPNVQQVQNRSTKEAISAAK